MTHWNPAEFIEELGGARGALMAGAAAAITAAMAASLVRLTASASSAPEATVLAVQSRMLATRLV